MKRLLLFLAFASAVWADSFPVHIEVDAAQSIGPLKPVWRFFGADEPNYAYMPHGRELLGGTRRTEEGRGFLPHA